jgi:hypothetical protein
VEGNGVGAPDIDDVPARSPSISRCPARPVPACYAADRFSPIDPSGTPLP